MPRTWVDYYCEENIYFLCKDLSDHTTGQLDVVFISNEKRMVPFLRQKVSDSTHEGQVLFWDYHVIAVERRRGGAQVYDPSSTLTCPCDLHDYARLGLGPASMFTRERLFRVVPSQLYLQHFASDRSHMHDVDGVSGWAQPPPPHPAIVAPDGTRMSLPRYWDMQLGEDERYGRVLSEEQFLAFCGCTAPAADNSSSMSNARDERDTVSCRQPALT